MTDDTSSKDDPPATDESPANRFVAGSVGTGKTTRFIELMATIHAESDPDWTDPKADDEDVTDGSES